MGVDPLELAKKIRKSTNTSTLIWANESSLPPPSLSLWRYLLLARGHSPYAHNDSLP
jgi:hypothetical protein